MLKSKGWIVAGVLAAALLPAPPVHASELVKLAKLLVTGKRAPAETAAVAKPVPPARESADSRWSTAPRSEERATGAPARQEPGEAAAADWAQNEVAPQPPRHSTPAPQPQQETPRADPNPSRGGGGGDRFEVATARLMSRTLA